MSFLSFDFHEFFDFFFPVSLACSGEKSLSCSGEKKSEQVSGINFFHQPEQVIRRTSNRVLRYCSDSFLKKTLGTF